MKKKPQIKELIRFSFEGGSAAEYTRLTWQERETRGLSACSTCIKHKAIFGWFSRQRQGYCRMIP
jgi:hypothetical protein